MLPVHLLLVAVLVLSVHSRLIVKSCALVHSGRANSSAGHLQHPIGMTTDHRVSSAAGATFLAGFCWLLVKRHSCLRENLRSWSPAPVNLASGLAV